MISSTTSYTTEENPFAENDNSYQTYLLGHSFQISAFDVCRPITEDFNNTSYKKRSPNKFKSKILASDGQNLIKIEEGDILLEKMDVSCFIAVGEDATNQKQSPKVTIWNGKSGKLLSTIFSQNQTNPERAGHSILTGICALSFSPNGLYLTIIGNDKLHTCAIFFSDTQWFSYNIVKTFPAGNSTVNALTWINNLQFFILGNNFFISYHVNAQPKFGIFSSGKPTNLTCAAALGGELFAGSSTGSICKMKDIYTAMEVKFSDTKVVNLFELKNETLISVDKEGKFGVWSKTLSLIHSFTLDSVINRVIGSGRKLVYFGKEIESIDMMYNSRDSTGSKCGRRNSIVGKETKVITDKLEFLIVMDTGEQYFLSCDSKFSNLDVKMTFNISTNYPIKSLVNDPTNDKVFFFVGEDKILKEVDLINRRIQRYLILQVQPICMDCSHNGFFLALAYEAPEKIDKDEDEGESASKTSSYVEILSMFDFTVIIRFAPFVFALITTLKFSTDNKFLTIGFNDGTIMVYLTSNYYKEIFRIDSPVYVNNDKVVNNKNIKLNFDTFNEKNINLSSVVAIDYSKPPEEELTKAINLFLHVNYSYPKPVERKSKKTEGKRVEKEMDLLFIDETFIFNLKSKVRRDKETKELISEYSYSIVDDDFEPDDDFEDMSTHENKPPTQYEWSSHTCRQGYTLRGLWYNNQNHLPFVTCAINPSQTLIVTTQKNGEIRINKYPITTPNEEVMRFHMHNGEVDYISFIGEKMFVSHGKYDNQLIKWKIGIPRKFETEEENARLKIREYKRQCNSYFTDKMSQTRLKEFSYRYKLISFDELMKYSGDIIYKQIKEAWTTLDMKRRLLKKSKEEKKMIKSDEFLVEDSKIAMLQPEQKEYIMNYKCPLCFKPYVYHVTKIAKKKEPTYDYNEEEGKEYEEGVEYAEEQDIVDQIAEEQLAEDPPFIDNEEGVEDV